MLLFQDRNFVVMTVIMTGFFVADCKATGQGDMIPIEVVNTCDNPKLAPMLSEELAHETYAIYQKIFPKKIFGDLFFSRDEQFTAAMDKCSRGPSRNTRACRRLLEQETNLVCHIRSAARIIIETEFNENSDLEDEEFDDDSDLDSLADSQ